MRKTINNRDKISRMLLIITDNNLMPPSHNRGRILPLHCGIAASKPCESPQFPERRACQNQSCNFLVPHTRLIVKYAVKIRVAALAYLLALATVLSPRMYPGVEFRLGLYHHEHIFARTKYFRLSHVRPPLPRDFIALLRDVPARTCR